MIFLTGDCHGSFRRFTRRQRMKLPYVFTEKDCVIVTGDFGLIWYGNDAEAAYNCGWLSGLPFRLLFVDGNHENFDKLEEYPVEEWNGGKVHQIVRDKIIHLMRGQIFQIEGKSFYTFGGAKSHDIQGGVLDRDSPTYDLDRRRAIKSGLPYRVRGYSWWEQELPTEMEMQEGRDNLFKAEYCVDYVITHCLSSSMQKKLHQYHRGTGSSQGVYERDILTDYFDGLESTLCFKHWFCGHYHEDLELDDRHTILYENIVSLQGY